MKLGILSALWGRPELTTMFLNRLNHLRNKFGIMPIVVGTDFQFFPQCRHLGIYYANYDNKPLSNKWNYGMSKFRDVNVSHVMILGSDDFVSDDFIEFSIKIAEGKDFTGCKDLYIFGANPKRRGWKGLFYFAHKGCLVGPGRCYSKRILEMMDFTPWDSGRNTGLDGSIARNVKRLGGTVARKSFVMKNEGLFMVDIKTLGNISSIPGAAKPVEADFGDMLSKNLPTKESKELIKHLKKIDAI